MLLKKIMTRMSYSHAFTIVELLVVIVVIGILASLTIVSFSGISQRASVAAVQSDLNNASKLLKLYYTTYSSYPSALDGNYCPAAPTVDNTYCLKPSTGNTLTYTSVAPSSTFHLKATNSSATTIYSINNNTAPTITTTVNGSSAGSPCPTGYIPVPGSGTYGTNDFCVMKYEAKCALISDLTTGLSTAANVYNNSTTNCTSGNSRAVVSVASGFPLTNISQTNAIAYAQNACTGCKLITEAEWMTIAQNVLSVPSNWNGGVVGTSYIFNGHNDNSPANALAAAADGDPYNGTGNVSPSSQKRTLTLTNGEVIWDIPGNVNEWTSGATTNQPGIVGQSGFTYKEWPAVNYPGSVSTNPSPSSTGITGAAIWNGANGVGGLYSSITDTTNRAFRRGGDYTTAGASGLLRLGTDFTADGAHLVIGFRVSL